MLSGTSSSPTATRAGLECPPIRGNFKVASDTWSRQSDEREGLRRAVLFTVHGSTTEFVNGGRWNDAQFGGNSWGTAEPYLCEAVDGGDDD